MREKDISITNYPFIFVHGMYGFGEDVKINNYLPYWGMFTGSLTKYLNANGFVCYAPSVGPISSAWDRACELYAQLFGGTVDYGVAHSKEHSHHRFGRTYDAPTIKDIGKRNPNGTINKVNLVGHSFGGETIRMLTHLLEFGSLDEQRATSANDISPLFVGGKGRIIHSVTTVSSPHNGITTFYANRSALDIDNYKMFLAGNIIGNTKLNDFYDFHLEQFDLSGTSKETRSLGKTFNTVGVAEVVQGRDNVYYDLSLYGAKKMNQFLRTNTHSYYFSFATCSKSKKTTDKSRRISIDSISLALRKLEMSIGTYPSRTFNNIQVDEKWLASDGAANTYSSLAPLNEPSARFLSSDSVEKGIWNIMDIQYVKHMEIVGKVFRKSDRDNFRALFLNHLNMINSLSD
ncbi:MAG: hypothetical protein EOM05_08205 [Clostridia bacterium]|nr:hypothetical protein [Clostridia bacterium]